MSIADWFLLLVRWLHLLGAVAWVGGSIFILAVLRPTLQGSSQEAAFSRTTGREFRNLVDVAVSVLLVTGVILSVSRLTSGHATVAYGFVLGLKIILALGMFSHVWFRGRRQTPTVNQESATVGSGPMGNLRGAFTANSLVLALGIIVLLLADLLGVLFENAIGGT
ncbi:MAG: CopD family protein [Chloroflexi bacterium]|nr:CopD family protein [Chloroflexota bacterium]